MTTAEHTTQIVLFDGKCNLCARSVQFIIRRDARRRFRFAPRESDAGTALLAPYGMVETPPNSIVLISDGRVYLRSDAALRIAAQLRWPWPLLGAFLLIPAPLRDCAYRFIAKRRYRWFGESDSCWVPTPELRSRFLS
jgi:predicted DCC family thiol-disulfide oxidoreductase YuxK